jgi:hypothetical protein
VVALRFAEFNQRREMVLEGLQKVLIRRRPASAFHERERPTFADIYQALRLPLKAPCPTYAS